MEESETLPIAWVTGLINLGWIPVNISVVWLVIDILALNGVLFSPFYFPSGKNTPCSHKS